MISKDLLKIETPRFPLLFILPNKKKQLTKISESIFRFLFIFVVKVFESVFEEKYIYFVKLM